MKWRCALTLIGCLAAPFANAALHVVIVEGLGGEAAFATQFAEQAGAIRKASLALSDAEHVHLLDSKAATRTAVLGLFATIDATATADDRLALFLIGHGSYDGSEYKLNITGPDLTGSDLKDLLTKFPARDQLIVVAGSSSGALQDVLKSSARVVMTGTRSGSERNATRFGAELVKALTDAAADTDKNGSLSAQEAFEFAQRNVKAFYEREVRLASEHAQISGDRAGRFALARVAGGNAGGAGAASAATPLDAVTQAQRDQINNALDALRLRKSDMPEDEYNAKLEALLLQLATLDEGAGGASPP